jgi:molecular chaperone DnaK (HSP70)
MGLEKEGRFDPKRVTYDGFSEAGARMDQRLLEYCIDKAGKEVTDWFGKQNILVRRRVRRSVESAKIRLSTERTATVEFPGSQLLTLRLIELISLALSPIMNRMIAKVSEVVIKAVGRLENG